LPVGVKDGLFHADAIILMFSLSSSLKLKCKTKSPKQNLKREKEKKISSIALKLS